MTFGSFSKTRSTDNSSVTSKVTANNGVNSTAAAAAAVAAFRAGLAPTASYAGRSAANKLRVATEGGSP